MLVPVYDRVGVSSGEAPPATTAKVNKEKRREGKTSPPVQSSFSFPREKNIILLSLERPGEEKKKKGG